MNITQIAKATSNCVGCGICVTACPVSHLRLGRNEWNQLEILENENPCLEKCSICMRVCPFSDHSKNEDTLAKELFKETPQSHSVLGSFIQTYEGHHPDESKRWNAASGGLTTYLLDSLLQQGMVDAIVCAARTEGSPYFKSVVCRSSEEVYAHARSAYAVIHLDTALKEAIEDEQITSIAVVALPCQAKALRNAMQYQPKLRKKLKYILGLVCGQQKSTNFADYLAAKSQVDSLCSIDFRKKKSGRPNGNFGVSLIGGQRSKSLTFSDYGKEWSFKMFTLPACNVCDDIFAETADVVLMDAWLPEYQASDKGENLVIVRNKEFDSLLKGISTVHSIEPERVVLSQSYVVHTKRKWIQTALKYYQQHQLLSPRKREVLLQQPELLETYLNKVKTDISLHTDQLWIQANRDYHQFTRLFNKRYQKRLLIGLILNKLHIIFNRKSK